MDLEISNMNILAEVLGSSVNSATEASTAVAKDDYSKLVAFGNVTSYSMEQLLHSCARKFQLAKLTAGSIDSAERESNATFAFGHAVGAGVACYDGTRSLKDAIFAAFLSWNIDLFEEQERKSNRAAPNKSFHHAIWALYCYETFYRDETDFADYELVKAEATLAVDFENGHYYVGHIDEQLRHKETGSFKIKENKTTVYATVDPALYSNSDQALSYALVIDAVGASEYDVVYCIYSSTDQRWMLMEFVKSALQKAEWLQDHTMMHSVIDMYSEANFFPKRGKSCIEFGRRCQQYETCDYNPDQVYGMQFKELQKVQSFADLEAIKPFDYKFTWSDIVSNQRNKL
jgi:hypothetical protein